MTLSSTTYGTLGPLRPAAQDRVRLRPLGIDAVQLDRAGHLGAWQDVNRTATIPHCIANLESSGVLNNFRRLLDPSLGEFAGMWFADSDLYKTLEAIGWELHRDDDPDLRGFVDQAVDLLARVQQEDGYLNSWFQGPKAGERWTDLSWGHELYCAGHLFQAAVALQRGAGDARLLRIAVRFADHLVDRFGGDDPAGFCGHPEVETALIQLYRETERRPYLELATAMLDRRGHRLLSDKPFGHAYFQDHTPVRDADVATGHAVRQLYLTAGVVDAYLETGDERLLKAAEAVWASAVTSKTYITGGQGSRHRDESFGDPFELPSDRAYAESCAAIANFMLSERLLVATGQKKYADELERLLFNAIEASVSGDGCRFFYSNPLQLREGHDGSTEDAPSERLAWYRCACCPPNLARLLSSLGAYVATSTDAGLDLQLATSGTLCAEGEEWSGAVSVATGFPATGGAALTIESSEGEWTLGIRIPAGAAQVTATVNGEPLDPADGYVRVRRAWRVGDRLEVAFDLPVHAITSHPRVDATRGCIALRRGPVVYCVEQADLGGHGRVDDLVVDARDLDAIETFWHDDLGTVALRFQGAVREPDSEPLYSDLGSRSSRSRQVPATAVPYARWANRGPGAMRVWLPLELA